jgi:hypothetical protein
MEGLRDSLLGTLLLHASRCFKMISNDGVGVTVLLDVYELSIVLFDFRQDDSNHIKSNQPQ